MREVAAFRVDVDVAAGLFSFALGFFGVGGFSFFLSFFRFARVSGWVGFLVGWS